MFANREFPETFNTYFADSVDIIIVGQDSHIGGHYNSTQAFHDNIYARITAALKMETLRLPIKRVIGGGESSWAAIEPMVTVTSKYGSRNRGKPYSLGMCFSGFCSSRRIILSRVCGLSAVQLAGKDCSADGVLRQRAYPAHP